MICNFPLIDGPLVIKPRESRKETVERMAADLVRFDAFQNPDDAFSTLAWCRRYSVFEIMTCLPDARQAAMQSVVAREMSES